MGSKDWIEKATSKNKGSFSAAAKKAGESTAEYADEKASAGGKMGRRARLAQTLMSMNKGGK
jgi:hypothetical protein